MSGTQAAEAELLAAYRDRRLAHAWLIGGPQGVGKATLAWRFARFLLANPDPDAPRVREARDLRVDAEQPAARQLAALAHPDFALIRREWKGKPKRLGAEIGVDEVRDGAPGVPDVGGVRRLADLHRRLRRGPQPQQRQRAPEDDRGAAAALADPDRVASAGAGAADHSLALPPPQARSAVAARNRRSRRRRWARPGATPIRRRSRDAAGRANGSVREALARLGPDSEGIGALIDVDRRRSAPSRPARGRQARRGARRPRRGRGLRGVPSRDLSTGSRPTPRRARLRPPGAEELGALWDRIRAAARETEALNLDRKLHVLAVFAEIAATARRRG